jgi:hypothetical protein
MIFDLAIVVIFDPVIATIFDPVVAMIFDAVNHQFDHAIVKDIQPDSSTPVEPKTLPDRLQPLGANAATTFLTGKIG